MRYKTVTMWVLIVGIVVATAGRATADVSGEGNTISLTDGSSGSTATQGGVASGTAGGLAPGTMLISLPVMVGPNQYCMVPTVVDTGTVLPPLNPVSSMTQVPCPASLVPPPPPPTASDVINKWAHTAVLPAPALQVAPGYAVTGLTAFLEITTPDPWAVAVPDPIRSDTISVVCRHSSFVVDWGDGTTATTNSTGGPYPSGDVTHAYQSATLPVPLVVDETWACHWSDPLGHAGDLAGLHSAGRLALEVREIQALAN